MFILLNVEDKLILDPSELNTKQSFETESSLPQISTQNKYTEEKKEKPPLKYYNEIIYEKLRKKYINKILLNQGLVISIQKFKIKNDLIIEIEGVIDIDYECNLIIFKPIEGEILFGNIEESNLNNIIVNIGIIKVNISKDNLMKPSNFNEEEKVWFWSYGNNNYFYDKGEKCRMKVLNVKFKSKVEISKIIKNDNENIENEDFDNEKNNNLNKEDIMQIYCTFNEEGLGPIKWWSNK